ncbi:hypothetical protein Q8A67_017067 [Cirrhinus molitorella]|uniref:Uncharacterized protein n=1 Tax=Cirrhinus molitorella TaxID=172907 RepID=A0AA88PIW3_9TELE|nr:hypothetical protein Q8A67_017067 [Cirrhinus molitorella]
MLKTDTAVFTEASTQHDTHVTDSQRGHAVLHEKALQKTKAAEGEHDYPGQVHRRNSKQLSACRLEFEQGRQRSLAEGEILNAEEELPGCVRLRYIRIIDFFQVIRGISAGLTAGDRRHTVNILIINYSESPPIEGENSRQAASPTNHSSSSSPASQSVTQRRA